jgi:hypothetical protein
VPWISVFDPAITTSATRGYYVVYLFHAHEPIVHLSLNQGTTAVREEFGARAREILKDRADLMRKRVTEFAAFCLRPPSNLAQMRAFPAIMLPVMRWAQATRLRHYPMKKSCAPIFKRSCAHIEP